MVDWLALWDGYAWPGIIIVAQIVAILVPLLLSVAEKCVIGVWGSADPERSYMR